MQKVTPKNVRITIEQSQNGENYIMLGQGTFSQKKTLWTQCVNSVWPYSIDENKLSQLN